MAAVACPAAVATVSKSGSHVRLRASGGGVGAGGGSGGWASQGVAEAHGVCAGQVVFDCVGGARAASGGGGAEPGFLDTVRARGRAQASALAGAGTHGRGAAAGRVCVAAVVGVVAVVWWGVGVGVVVVVGWSRPRLALTSGVTSAATAAVPVCGRALHVARLDRIRRRRAARRVRRPRGFVGTYRSGRVCGTGIHDFLRVFCICIRGRPRVACA